MLSGLGTPTGISVAFSDPFEAVLTFPQAMNTGSVPATTDFTLEIDGLPSSCDSVTWVDSTHLKLVSDSSDDPHGIDVEYNPGVNPLENAGQTESYGAFGPINCPRT